MAATKCASTFTTTPLVEDWNFAAGLVDGRPAALVHRPDISPLTPAYFVLLAWDGERVMHIRDFRYARYATEGAELSVGP
jgi:RNA polymerase sigma-70 factor (ECF subfamily)